MKKDQLRRLLSNYKFLLVVYLCITIAASLGEYWKAKPGDPYTHYNNFLIFRQSFHHVSEGSDLYKKYEQEYFDLYKYSPGFAVCMAPFTLLPDLPGLIGWNLINALILFFALYFLPNLDKRAKIFMLWFVLLELLTSLQNSQSNGLIAGLLVWAFIQFEKRNVALASLFIMVCVFIKIFGILAIVLALLYPDKIKFILYSVLWAVLFAFLPLLITNWETLLMQYKSWFNLNALEHSISYGISVYGILHSLFRAEINKNIVMGIGLLILLAPLLHTSRYKEYEFRGFFFSSLLIWLIIFNYRAESPTFIIAISGIAIWFFSETKKNRLEIFLLWLVLILTSFSPTDLFPRSWRNGFVTPYSLKALPCVLVWIKINYDLLLKNT